MCILSAITRTEHYFPTSAENHSATDRGIKSSKSSTKPQTVADIRNKLEQIKSKEEIYRKYSPPIRQKPRPKPAMSLPDKRERTGVQDSSSKFSNIRAMFESEANIFNDLIINNHLLSQQIFFVSYSFR